MTRKVDINKVLRHAAETKAINLDVTVGAVASAGLIGAFADAEDDWYLICATWMAVIHYGPNTGVISELTSAATSLRESAAIVARATGNLKGGG